MLRNRAIGPEAPQPGYGTRSLGQKRHSQAAVLQPGSGTMVTPKSLQCKHQSSDRNAATGPETQRASASLNKALRFLYLLRLLIFSLLIILTSEGQLRLIKLVSSSARRLVSNTNNQAHSLSVDAAAANEGTTVGLQQNGVDFGPLIQVALQSSSVGPKGLQVRMC